MNPFESNTINTKIENTYNIEIWTELCRRKTNTYILGWTLDENQLKYHIKFIKKKNGCNGTIKKMLINEVENTVILFQGNHIDFIKKYLLEQGIDKDNIYIKG
jgi:translation initiation factor 1 (eIF-1/SUI1)